MSVFLITYHWNTDISPTTVTQMPTVLTPKAHSIAPVEKDTLEMGYYVLVCICLRVVYNLILHDVSKKIFFCYALN